MRLSVVLELLPLAGVIAGLRSPWQTWPCSSLPWLCFFLDWRPPPWFRAFREYLLLFWVCLSLHRWQPKPPAFPPPCLDHVTGSDITLRGRAVMSVSHVRQKQGSNGEPQATAYSCILQSLSIIGNFIYSILKIISSPQKRTIALHGVCILCFHLGLLRWGAFGFVQDRNPSFTAGHEKVAMLLIYFVPSWTLLSNRKMNCPAAI